VFPQDLAYGYYSLKKKHGDPKKHLDWAIVEATAITEDGHIVPGKFQSSQPLLPRSNSYMIGASVGASPEILETAEKIIIVRSASAPCQPLDIFAGS
jgi:acetyl-CoA hydrolase